MIWLVREFVLPKGLHRIAFVVIVLVDTGWVKYSCLWVVDIDRLKCSNGVGTGFLLTFEKEQDIIRIRYWVACFFCFC